VVVRAKSRRWRNASYVVPVKCRSETAGGRGRIESSSNSFSFFPNMCSPFFTTVQYLSTAGELLCLMSLAASVIIIIKMITIIIIINVLLWDKRS